MRKWVQRMTPGPAPGGHSSQPHSQTLKSCPLVQVGHEVHRAPGNASRDSRGVLVVGQGARRQVGASKQASKGKRCQLYKGWGNGLNPLAQGRLNFGGGIIPKREGEGQVPCMGKGIRSLPGVCPPAGASPVAYRQETPLVRWPRHKILNQSSIPEP